ncbi:hypothetical protein E5161_03895 [Cohnella pontilimi]|uniref:Lipoprotein n=1 Tax=Cohnella pontilimi TaxID=2564100 RepID=A0A4U0FHT2_9BACL|nr:hypothetical protein [Cohnella pontilimi]TJY44527.1 hypothetical protein E5161_03895 [Cohnella pontilimi]
MNRKALGVAAFFVIMMILLTGCVPGNGTHTEADPAGFFWGIWHGWIAPISLIIGFFKHNVRVYEVHNSGWWYDFGFYLAVVSGFGGLSFTRRRYVKHGTE